MPLFTFTFPNQAAVCIEVGKEINQETVLAKGEIPLHTVKLPLARVFKIKPSEVTGYLKVKIGDVVHKDDVVALKRAGILGKSQTVCRSPAEGKILSINGETGEAEIGFDFQEFKLTGEGKGTVKNLTAGDISIEYNGETLPLTEAVGGTGSGPILTIPGKEEVNPFSLANEIKGTILVGYKWGKVSVTKAAALGAKGILGVSFLYNLEGGEQGKGTLDNQVINTDLPVGKISDNDYNKISRYNQIRGVMDGGQKLLCLLKP